MARLELIGRQTVEGERRLTVSLPVGVTMGVLRFPRHNWPVRAGAGRDGEVMQADVEIDYGNGWEYLRGIGAGGGNKFYKGDLIVETARGLPLAQPDNPKRRLRITINCKARLDFACHLDIE